MKRGVFFRLLGLMVLWPLCGCNAQSSDFRMVAESFIDRPYGAGTLEVEGEPLVVRTDSVDCLTFVEYVVAAVVSGESPNEENIGFRTALEKIRYRGGVRDGYASRLHYSSEWILDNVEKGVISDVSADYPHRDGMKRINFMSRHANSYPMLKADTSLIYKIEEAEARVTDCSYSYIPKDKVESVAQKFQDGDIVMFMTNVEGLDISHTGFVYNDHGTAKLLHASSKYGKVCIDRNNLADYVLNSSRCTGIRVLRINR